MDFTYPMIKNRYRTIYPMQWFPRISHLWPADSFWLPASVGGGVTAGGGTEGSGGGVSPMGAAWSPDILCDLCGRMIDDTVHLHSREKTCIDQDYLRNA